MTYPIEDHLCGHEFEPTLETRGGVWQATVHEVTIRHDLETEQQQMQGTVLEDGICPQKLKIKLGT